MQRRHGPSLTTRDPAATGCERPFTRPVAIFAGPLYARRTFEVHLFDKEQDVDLVMCLVSLGLLAVLGGFVWAMEKL
jgi:hypothetical protein